jgi:hypothetical protein
MKTISISDPHDVCYPFSKEWHDDPFILYHGTSSVYSQNIEEKGWIINDQPYDIADFQKICKIYDDMGWIGTPYPVLHALTMGVGDKYVKTKQASFSREYPIARNYSINLGGESINSLFLAIDEITNISNNSALQKAHEISIKKELDELEKNSNNSLSYEIDNYKKNLSNMTESFFNESKKFVLELLKKYEHVKINHVPIVYVVKVEPSWFENYGQELDDEDRPITDIPSSSIIAKVNLPKNTKHVIF